MKLKTLAVAVAAIAALAVAAQGKSAGTVETTPDSRVGNVTKDKTRDPGLFGAHWWAHRFLSRHMEIEKFKGKSVDASGWVPKTIMRDEIHPTAAGYDIWMEALAPVIGK